MDFPNTTLWSPTPDWIERAALTELGRRIGTDNYDALYAKSLEDPAAYWKAALEHVGIEWMRPYESFCRFTNGKPFPRWFEGGTLNWVQSALRWSRDDSLANAVAVITENEAGRIEQTTYAELDAEVRCFAMGLRQNGIERGDRVGLMMPMGRAAIVTFLAISSIGAICVPLFTGFGSDAVTARLGLAEAKMLVVADGFSRRGRNVASGAVIAAAAADLPGLETVVVYRHTGQEMRVPCTQIDWESLLSGDSLVTFEEMDPNDPFMIVFTSGTTGEPKGTVHTHGGFPLKIATDVVYHFELKRGDRWYWPSDMGWVVGPITTIGTLITGATLLCYDGAPDFPSWSRFPSMLERHRITHFGASPTLIRSLAANEPASVAGNVESLRVLMSAGEVLHPEHFEWFFRKFGGGLAPVINYTGGTEASGALFANVVVRPIKASGFNSASPGVCAYAGDESGTRVIGRVGELTVAMPFIGMTRSFWNADDRYLDAYWSAVPGMWIHGDLLYEDDDGHFFLLGRSDDTIKVAGKRVGPAEIESIVLDALPVREAAAVGLEDAVKGQRIVVCVVPHSANSDLSVLEKEVASRIEAALGKPFRPSEVHCLNDLPKTRNSKVMRRVIRRILSGQEPGDLSALENPAAVEELRIMQAGRQLLRPEND